MGSNMKLAAERLFKIADDLEKEAAENTFFVCEGCNHTSSLADINIRRKTAGEQHKVKRIANVSVNDSVSCPACGDKMSYVPTEMSEKYYVEAEDDQEDTGADIFEPVDEQGKDETSDMSEPEGDIPQAVNVTPIAPENESTPEGDIPENKDEETSEITDYDGDDSEVPSDETPTEGAPDESTPDVDETPELPAPESDSEQAPEEGAPEETPALPAPDGEEPIVEETVPEEEGPTGEQGAPGLEGVPGEEEPVEEKDVEVPKKEVPKFEKIPKDASEDFIRAIAKYSI
jgi:hypothetical protein